MAVLNSEVRHVFSVVDNFDVPVTGLTDSNFILTLRRQSGLSLIATSEVPTVVEIGGGDYWAIYTPTVAATLYVLQISAMSLSNVVSAPAEGYQDQITYGGAPSEVRHVFKVTDILGVPVSGLGSSSFTTSLRRMDASTLVAASEVPAVSGISGGEYWIVYTPTTLETLYVLRVSAVSPSHLVSAPPEGFQDEVGIDAAGPFLTSRNRVKTAFNIRTAEHDARIDMLLAQVTDLFQTYCNRKFWAEEITEYPAALSSVVGILLSGRPPIVEVESLHLSTGIPRVYDATTLLVEGTDYLISEDGQWIELVTPRHVRFPSARFARLVYTGGFTQIPGDLERAAQEVIGVKVMKGAGKLYHFLSESKGDGLMQGLRWDDITPNALAVMDSYRLRSIA